LKLGRNLKDGHENGIPLLTSNGAVWEITSGKVAYPEHLKANTAIFSPWHFATD